MKNKNLLLAASVLLLTGCGGASGMVGVAVVAGTYYYAVDSGMAVRDDGGDPRRAPPMAADRKVNEVDCTQPIDYSLGNIRCK